MLDTYFLEINRNLKKAVFERLLNFVSEEKKERISRFYWFEDAQNSLLGDILARYAICKRLNIDSRELVFCTNEYGKPVLLKPHGVHFNISHSGNWVVCAVDDNPVGIDVEMIKPIDLKVAKRFFSRNEYISLINQPEEMKLKFFYQIWTLKESYIKMKGKGLKIPLNSFSVNMDQNDISVSVNNKIQPFSFYQSFIDSAAVYAVCTHNSNTNKGIYLNIEKFLKEVHDIVYHAPFCC